MFEPRKTHPVRIRPALALAGAALIATVSLSVPQASPEPLERPEPPNTAMVASEASGAILADLTAPEPKPAPPPSTTTTYPPPPPTTTTEAPPPQPVSQPAASGAVPDIIRRVFSPYGQAAVDTALRVARCESNYNPRAQNPSGASGLFQVMPGWADEYASVTGQPYYDGRFSPTANARFAAWLAYEASGGGWGHWSCF